MSEEINELEVFLDLFQHPGWKLFTEDFEKKKEYAEQAIFSTTEANHIFHQRGVRDVIVDILTYEESVRTVYDDLTSEVEEVE